MAPPGGVTAPRLVDHEATDLGQSFFNHDNIDDSHVTVKRRLPIDCRQAKRATPLGLKHTFAAELHRLAGKAQDIALNDFGTCLGRSLRGDKQKYTRKHN